MKDVSGFKYETIGDFNKLRVELRKIEREHQVPVTEKGSRKAVHAQQIVAEATNKESEISELKYLVQDMSMTMKAMGKEIADLKKKHFNINPIRTSLQEEVERGITNRIMIQAPLEILIRTEGVILSRI